MESMPIRYGLIIRFATSNCNPNIIICWSFVTTFHTPAESISRMLSQDTDFLSKEMSGSNLRVYERFISVITAVAKHTAKPT